LAAVLARKLAGKSLKQQAIAGEKKERGKILRWFIAMKLD
jgi:hypothetical protein